MGHQLSFVTRGAENSRKLCYLLQEQALGKKQNNLFLLLDAGGPLAIESLPLEVWLSKECALSSLGMHGLILLTIKGRWRPDDPLGLYLPRWDQSSSWTFTLHGVKFYSLTMEKLKLVSVRLVLFHCSFLESQLKNCTCSMTIQQCLQKCSSVKLKSFCLR